MAAAPPAAPRLVWLAAGLAASAERRIAGIIRAPVDLVRVEEAPSGLVERVVREGMCLHDTA